jgi:hypothetical protein
MMSSHGVSVHGAAEAPAHMTGIGSAGQVRDVLCLALPGKCGIRGLQGTARLICGIMSGVSRAGRQDCLVLRRLSAAAPSHRH